jgi:hypothetical protein
MLALLVAAALRARAMASWQRSVLAGAGLVLAFNWVLHSVYGSELFLYSQHWEIPLLVVLAGLAAPIGAHRRLAQGALVALIVLGSWNTVHVWQRTLHMLVPGDATPATAADAGRRHP